VLVWDVLERGSGLFCDAPFEPAFARCLRTLASSPTPLTPYPLHGQRKEQGRTRRRRGASDQRRESWVAVPPYPLHALPQA